NLPVRPAGASAAAVAGARAGIGVAPPEPYDPDRIRAALRGGQAGSAAESRTSQPDPLGAEAPSLGRPSWDAGTGQEASVGWDTNSSSGTAWDTATGGRSGWDTAAEAGAGAGLDAV